MRYDRSHTAIAPIAASLPARHSQRTRHVEVDKFRFLAGEDMTVRYESAPGSFRYRCKICGCLTPGKASYLQTVSIPAGLFDDDPKVRPRLHVFTSSRAPWWTIQDDLPQHEKWVPGYGPKP
jgi:hypothetical protein